MFKINNYILSANTIVRRILPTILTLCVCFNLATANEKSAVVETDSSIMLKNKYVEIVFAKKNFDIKSIILSGQKVLSNQGLNAIPWVLTYKGPQGENPQFFPSHAVYKGCEANIIGDTAKITFSWQLTLTYEENAQVSITVSLPGDSELAYWDIQSGTPEGWVVSNTQFPRIFFDRPKDAKVITSAGWGAEYNMNSQTYTSSYPSWSGAMQLMLIHNSEGALYYATEDYNACGKDYRASVGNKSVALITDIVNSEAWSDHNKKMYTLPWTTVIGFSKEGWKDAASKWYRPFTYKTEWGSKSLESRNIPQWLYDADLWIRAKGINENVMSAVRKSIDYFGKGTAFHWYYWHNHLYDSHYPDYFPAKEPFAEWVSEVRSKGCYVVPYINGRLWDPDADSYKAMNGASASCRKPDGTLYTEIYPTSKVLNTVTCPASELWQQVLTNLIDKIQKDLKTNGVYIDQISAAAPQPCYAKNHGHAPGNGDFWYKSYRKLMESLYKDHLIGDNILFSEENAECYIDMFDMLLTVNSPHSDCRIVPLFPIVYSGRLITAAYTYTPVDKVTRGDHQYQNMQCFLFGSQLGWVDPTLLLKDEAKKEAAFLKELAQMRRKQHDVFYGGRYITDVVPTGDNPEVDIPGFGKTTVVCGAEWQSKNGQRVLYLVNMDTKDHIVTVDGLQPTKVAACKAIRINFK
ncbi:MAG: DUF6259 domain-containing protein [Muribaculaceae bacterium]|nr:DUF6259 domain-containing protein [Muribaculaceae bacterium]